MVGTVGLGTHRLARKLRAFEGLASGEGKRQAGTRANTMIAAWLLREMEPGANRQDRKALVAANMGSMIQICIRLEGYSMAGQSVNNN